MKHVPSRIVRIVTIGAFVSLMVALVITSVHATTINPIQSPIGPFPVERADMTNTPAGTRYYWGDEATATSQPRQPKAAATSRPQSAEDAFYAGVWIGCRASGNNEAACARMLATAHQDDWYAQFGAR